MYFSIYAVVNVVVSLKILVSIRLEKKVTELFFSKNRYSELMFYKKVFKAVQNCIIFMKLILVGEVCTSIFNFKHAWEFGFSLQQEVS